MSAFNVEEYEGDLIYCDGCEKHVRLITSKCIGGERKGELITYYRGCECEEIRLAKEAQERKDRLKREYALKVFDTHSLINRDLIKATFDGYQPTTDLQATAKTEVVNYARSFDPESEEGKNLLIVGAYGVGKSHLAVSAVREIMSRGFTCVFVSAPKLLTKIKATYNRDADLSEDKLLSSLESVDLLVIDDLGAETVSDWSGSKLFEIVDSRSGKHNIFTTNLNSQALADQIGQRNFSRLMLGTKVIKIDGKDRRIQSF